MPSSPSSCGSEQETRVSAIVLTSCPPLPEELTLRNTMAMIAVMSEPRRSRLPHSRNEGQTQEAEHNYRIDESSAWLASTNSSATRTSRNTSAVGNPGAGGARSVASSEIGTSASTSTSTIATKKTSNAVTPFTSDIKGDQPNIRSSLASMRGQSVDKSTAETRDIDADHEEATEESPKKKMSVDAVVVVPPKKTRKQRTPQSRSGQTNGRWTQQEHHAFLEGLKECGREWKKVALRIPTRTSAQIRSHAQKYFSRVERDHDTNFLQEGSALSPSVRGSASMGTDISTSTAFSPFVQRTVETILANPAEAQRRVESTLEALRERYRQLQSRLQERQLQKHTQLSSEQFFSSSRKRDLTNISRPRIESFSSTLEDHSSVSSNMSASAASMANDELIALSVLGDSLPRGDSSQDLERIAAQASGCSDDSVASSTMGPNTEEDRGNETSNVDGGQSPRKRSRSD